MDTDALRVLVVADDPLARAGLTTLLTLEFNCEVVGQVAGDIDLPGEINTFQPDVVIWDLGYNPGSTLKHLDQLNEYQPPIVALLPDDAHAADAWATGIRSLLYRNSPADKLLAALRATAHGLATIEPELTSELRPDRTPISDPPLEALTPRELEVLQLVAEGLSNKAIAHHLNISDHTVKFHVNAIMSKLEAQSRTEAVVRATRLGLLLL